MRDKINVSSKSVYLTVIFLISLLMLFSSCNTKLSTSKSLYHMVDSIDITMSISFDEDGSFVYTLNNHTLEDYQYGREFVLEMLEDDKWHTIDKSNNSLEGRIYFHNGTSELPANSINSSLASLTEYMESIHPGHYRIIKPVWLASNYNKIFYITYEFDVFD